MAAREIGLVLCCYFCMSLFVLSGLTIGMELDWVALSAPHVSPSPIEFLNIVTQWDGQWYLRIVDQGYTYAPERASNVAFFPMLPLFGRGVTLFTALSSHASLWVVAQWSLIGSLALFWKYLGAQRTSVALKRVGFLDRFAVAALVLYPPSFFLWMAYSESLFLLLCLVAMLGIQRGWHPLWIAIFAGAATGTRPVGVALLVPLALYVWRQERKGRETTYEVNRDWNKQTSTLLRLIVLLPIGCWGLLAFMAYQWHEFGTPFAFAQTQEHWSMRPAVDWTTKAVILASGEPVWSSYVPGSEGHWTQLEAGVHPLLSLHFFEPLYFVAAVVLVYIGARRRWLNVYEVLLAVGLLLIPYVTKGYEMTMASQARFATIVFPIYIVLGQILARVPWWAAIIYFALSGMYLAIYAAMWAAGHVLI
jgi:hypothetical protein